jgi:hypothetical protein
MKVDAFIVFSKVNKMHGRQSKQKMETEYSSGTYAFLYQEINATQS